MLGFVLRRQVPHRSRRLFFAGPGDALQGLLASRAGQLVRGDAAALAEFHEEQRTHGTQTVKDGLNGVFNALDVSLRVNSPGMGAYQDLSESGLKRRLEALNVEMKLIEKHLAEGLAAGNILDAAHRDVPRKSSAPTTAKSMTTEQPKQVPAKAQVLDPEEGEEYFEPDSLTRRLKKWYTVDACTDIPYRMMSTFELYPQWIPWCQSGTVLATHKSKGVTSAAVGFGIKVPFLGTLGDNIEYRVELDPPREGHGAARVYTISEHSRYMQKLVYDWRFVPLDDSRTKVILEVEFMGAAQWCMPIWEGLRRDVIDGISTAFRDRVVALQESSGGDHDRPAVRTKLASLTAVLQGPFLRDEAVVITESNGRTIRHANAGFATLARRPIESIIGKDIPDLLQNFGTDRNILRGLGAAIRDRLPATAVVLNQNLEGEQFMNRLTLAPLDDDEHDSGVVFWAVLKVVQGMDQQLELSKPDALDETWGPDYEHPDAISGRDVIISDAINNIPRKQRAV